MKCVCCDKILTTKESVRRFKQSGEFVDMCDNCLSTISDDVQVVDGKAGFDDEDDGYGE